MLTRDELWKRIRNAEAQVKRLRTQIEGLQRWQNKSRQMNTIHDLQQQVLRLHAMLNEAHFRAERFDYEGKAEEVRCAAIVHLQRLHSLPPTLAKRWIDSGISAQEAAALTIDYLTTEGARPS